MNVRTAIQRFVYAWTHNNQEDGRGIIQEVIRLPPDYQNEFLHSFPEGIEVNFFTRFTDEDQLVQWINILFDTGLNPDIVTFESESIFQLALVTSNYKAADAILKYTRTISPEVLIMIESQFRSLHDIYMRANTIPRN